MSKCLGHITNRPVFLHHLLQALIVFLHGLLVFLLGSLLILGTLLLHHWLIVTLVYIPHHILWLQQGVIETTIGKVFGIEGKLSWLRWTVFDISLCERTLIAMNFQLDCIGMDDSLRSTSTRLLCLGLFELLS